ncbi:MAG: ABC transporter permease, partial [Chloroflexota bacterium]|nr:ABC transporter permease [Chloroflexota bacterium]
MKMKKMDAKKIWTVARHEFVTTITRPGVIFGTLLPPALGLIALVVVGLFGGQAGQFFAGLGRQLTPQDNRVGYVDHTGIFTPPLPQYADTFIPYSDAESARAALMAEEIPGYMVIPADYMETGQVLGYTKGRGISGAMVVDSDYVEAFMVAHLLAGQVDPALQERVSKPADVSLVTLGEGEEAGQSDWWTILSSFVLPFFLSLLLSITIFVSAGYLLQGVGEEKEGRVIEILISSLTTTELLTGKILGLGAVGLAQIIIWFGAGWALMGGVAAIFAATGILPFGVGTLVLAMIYFLLGYLLFATIMGAVGSLGSTAREGQQLAGFFSMAAFMPMWFVSFIMANPDSPLARILSYFPLTSPTMILLRLGLGEVPAVDVVVSLVMLIAAIALCLWGGAKIFRMGLLTYGKRPSIKEIWGALRQA